MEQNPEQPNPMTDISGLVLQSKGSASISVSDAHTAIALGSGTLAVFATPMMVALMEAAAVDCVERFLPAGHTSLGTHIDVEHVAASPVGVTIQATAELVKIDGRSLTFALEARDEAELIGRGTHTRAVADIERFKARLARKTPTGS